LYDRNAKHIQPIVASAQPEYMTEPLPTGPDGSIAIENLADPRFAEIVAGRRFWPLGRGSDKIPPHKIYPRVVQSTQLPTVLDADGLNAFAGNADALRERKSQFLAITPHPGEMARLLGISNAEVQKIACVSLLKQPSAGTLTCC